MNRLYFKLYYVIIPLERWYFSFYPYIVWSYQQSFFEMVSLLVVIFRPLWYDIVRVWKTIRRMFRRNMKTVTIYTDGACSGNPGPGGWGAILCYGPHQKEISGGEKNTTNNRMELTAVIKSLELLKEPCAVELYSDSKYVIDALEKGWAKGWRARGWVKSDKKPALNPDLWGRLLELCEYHTVRTHWVKGHAENPYNNRCDEMAVSEWQKLK